MIVTVIDAGGGIYSRECDVDYLVMGKHVEAGGESWVDLKLVTKSYVFDKNGRVTQKTDEKYITIWGDAGITIKRAHP